MNRVKRRNTSKKKNVAPDVKSLHKRQLRLLLESAVMSGNCTMAARIFASLLPVAIDDVHVISKFGIEVLQKLDATHNQIMRFFRLFVSTLREEKLKDSFMIEMVLYLAEKGSLEEAYENISVYIQEKSLASHEVIGVSAVLLYVLWKKSNVQLQNSHNDFFDRSDSLSDLLEDFGNSQQSVNSHKGSRYAERALSELKRYMKLAGREASEQLCLFYIDFLEINQSPILLRNSLEDMINLLDYPSIIERMIQCLKKHFSDDTIMLFHFYEVLCHKDPTLSAELSYLPMMELLFTNFNGNIDDEYEKENIFKNILNFTLKRLDDVPNDEAGWCSLLRLLHFSKGTKLATAMEILQSSTSWWYSMHCTPKDREEDFSVLASKLQCIKILFGENDPYVVIQSYRMSLKIRV